jgi:phage tail-like protein
VAYPREIWQNMPLYAQFADDLGIGLLRHFCEALQPHLDLVFNRLDQRDYFLDPEVAPGYWLDWLQQLVSLGPQGDRWLGLAVNPAWDSEDKRRLILGAWEYWQKKGTESGIRWAIEHWLLWRGASDPSRFQIYLPLGDRPTDQPPRWWDYYSSFDINSTRLILEQKFLGGYEGSVEFQPRWHWERLVDWPWDFTQPFPGHDGAFVNVQQQPAAPQRSPGPMMGVYRPYEVFTLRDRDEWPLIAPSIYELNPEILVSPNQPTPWIWLERLVLPRQLAPVGGGGGGSNPDESELIFRYQVDGFKYWDSFPFAPRPAEQAEVRDDRLEQWGNIEEFFTYQDSFGCPAREIPGGRQETIIVVIDGNSAWCFDYFTVWFVVITPPQNLTQHLRPGVPIGDCHDFYDSFIVPFYAPPFLAIEAAPVPPQMVGDPRAWYYPAADRQVVHDRDEPLIQPAQPARQWYAPWQDRWLTTWHIVDVPPVGCTPGLQVWDTVGTEVVVTPGNPGIPPNQFVIHRPAEVQTRIEPAIAPSLPFDFWEPWAVDRFLPLTSIPALSPLTALTGTGSIAPVSPTAPVPPVASVSPTASIPSSVGAASSPISSLRPISLPAARHWWDLRDWAIDPGDRFGYPGRDAQDVTQVIPEFWAWESPVMIWHHQSRWGDGSPFYYPGRPATGDRSEVVPVRELIHLCNVPDDWTTLTITDWHYQSKPPAERPPLNEQYPELTSLRDRAAWHLSLFTDQGSIEVPATAAVWENATGDRAVDYDPERGFTQIVVEFTLRPPEVLKAHAVSVSSGGRVLDYHNLPDVDLRSEGMAGFRYRQPIQRS